MVGAGDEAGNVVTVVTSFAQPALLERSSGGAWSAPAPLPGDGWRFAPAVAAAGRGAAAIA
jgi:hypothetical protein